jgi:hypothetical protein
MSDGHYCVVRDLGLVKGGKGMRHHEVVLDFNRRGMVALLSKWLARPATAEPVSHIAAEVVRVRSRG